MGGVNSSPRYVQEVGIGTSDGRITDTLHEGGIISIYYLGCIAGCFAGGWLADRIGRINGSVFRALVYQLENILIFSASGSGLPLP
jgi:MFS family permease